MTSDELRREIERCDREVWQCVENQRLNPEEDKLCAAQGEMDWLCQKLSYEEELEFAIAREAVARRAA